MSDLSDPGSFANAIADTRYRTLAAAFNFGTDGSIVGSEGAQSSDQLEDTTTRYLETYDDAAVAAEASTTNLYRSRIGFMTSVDSLIDNELLYNYVLDAFGLDPKVESKGKIRQVLISDLSNPASFANLQRDPKYRELAAAFNFGPDGGVLQPPEAQTDAEELATIQLYNTRVGTSASEEAAAKDENLYYHGAIARVRSLDDFLADKRLVAYALKAYGLEGAGITNTTLRAVLTSDPLDQDGDFDSRFGDPRLRDLAAAFNFTADGKIGRGPTQQAQLRSGILDTTDAYLRQTMETDAGAQNAGVRLALYFQRKAASINSAFDILADKALFEVVRTSLGLPVADVAGRDRDPGRHHHATARHRRLPGPAEGGEVPEPVQRALRFGQRHVVHVLPRVHHPRRRHGEPGHRHRPPRQPAADCYGAGLARACHTLAAEAAVSPAPDSGAACRWGR